METKIQEAVYSLSSLLSEVENNAGFIINPIGKVILAYRNITNALIDQYLKDPLSLKNIYNHFIDGDLLYIAGKCYLVLEELGAEFPDDRKVYLLNYIYQVIYLVIDFFEELQEMEIPIWYENSN